MLNFDFHTPVRILFGKDEEKRIGELLKSHRTKVLLHYGGSIKKSGRYETMFLKPKGEAFGEEDPIGGLKKTLLARRACHIRIGKIKGWRRIQ